MSVQNSLDSAIASINAIFEHLDADLDKALRKTNQKIFDETDKNIKPHNKSGALINALKQGTVKNGYWVGIDTQDAPHALFVHFPTKPHLIKPKRKKALRFAGKDGKFHYFFGPKTKQQQYLARKWVKEKAGGGIAHFKWPKHPGYKGDPFFYDAVESGMRYLDQQAQQLKLRD